MKLTRLIVFLFAAVVTVSVTAHAQSINSENLRQVKVDELSDSDIQAYYQKATSAGLSETQLYNIAIQRGMPESEIAKLKLRIAALSTKPAKTNADTNKINPDSVETQGSRLINEDAMKVPMQKNKKRFHHFWH